MLKSSATYYTACPFRNTSAHSFLTPGYGIAEVSNLSHTGAKAETHLHMQIATEEAVLETIGSLTEHFKL